MQQTTASFILLCTIGCLLSLGICSDQSKRCINPAGRHGLCIPFQNCQELRAISQQEQISSEDRKFLNESRCTTANTNRRFPSVCCPIEKLPRKPNCGWGDYHRLKGGQNAFLGEFPWTAIIEYRHRSNGQIGLHCGAALISTRYVLTAAHCIPSSTDDWQPIGVRLGEHDLNTAVDCYMEDCLFPPVTPGIEKIIVHEGYTPHSKDQYDDIALIRLDEEIEFSENVQPICLPIEESDRTRNITDSRWSRSVGWGLSKSSLIWHRKLEVGIKVLDRKDCSKLDGIKLRDTQFCTEIQDSEQEICAVNSGGYLVMLEMSLHSHTLYGISSFGNGTLCGSKEQPAVFTDVTKYIEWIGNNVEF